MSLYLHIHSPIESQGTPSRLRSVADAEGVDWAFRSAVGDRFSAVCGSVSRSGLRYQNTRSRSKGPLLTLAEILALEG